MTQFRITISNGIQTEARILSGRDQRAALDALADALVSEKSDFFTDADTMAARTPAGDTVKNFALLNGLISCGAQGVYVKVVSVQQLRDFLMILKLENNTFVPVKLSAADRAHAYKTIGDFCDKNGWFPIDIECVEIMPSVGIISLNAEQKDPPAPAETNNIYIIHHHALVESVHADTGDGIKVHFIDKDTEDYEDFEEFEAKIERIEALPQVY